MTVCLGQTFCLAGKKQAIDDTGFVPQIRNVLDWVANNDTENNNNTDKNSGSQQKPADSGKKKKPAAKK